MIKTKFGLSVAKATDVNKQQSRHITSRKFPTFLLASFLGAFMYCFFSFKSLVAVKNPLLLVELSDCSVFYSIEFAAAKNLRCNVARDSLNCVMAIGSEIVETKQPVVRSAQHATQPLMTSNLFFVVWWGIKNGPRPL